MAWILYTLQKLRLDIVPMHFDNHRVVSYKNCISYCRVDSHVLDTL